MPSQVGFLWFKGYGGNEFRVCWIKVLKNYFKLLDYYNEDLFKLPSKFAVSLNRQAFKWLKIGKVAVSTYKSAIAVCLFIHFSQGTVVLS
ncbi:hypothetical protein MANES_01G170801v8 [Manihot esculenta]|uniref:Uncharacterized protein n=1 Tax=Manihot esculenta TaxID=3983 RepID=A0ACB7IG93_MANES|nr:hypothetical protein MANES_01G170801v8 [Manihot esculenta]